VSQKTPSFDITLSNIYQLLTASYASAIIAINGMSVHLSVTTSYSKAPNDECLPIINTHPYHTRTTCEYSVDKT